MKTYGTGTEDRRVRRAESSRRGLAFCICWLTVAGAMGGCATIHAGRTGAASSDDRSQGGAGADPDASSEGRSGTGTEDAKGWGIEVLGIRGTAAGYMLDFRYRVIDPIRAMPLVERRARPYLIEQSSGARLLVPTPPKVGPLRPTSAGSPPLAGRDYFIFFANPGRFVKPGDRVTVVVGDVRLADLEVQ